MSKEEKINELFAKTLTSEISEEERKMLDETLVENELLRKRFDTLDEYWNRCHPRKPLHHIIEKTEKKLAFTYHPESRKLKNIFFRIAAIAFLLISLGLAVFYFLQTPVNQELIEYHARGEIKELLLPDETRVWLNSGSYLIAAEPFDDDLRQVRLYGEAYFEVSHDAGRPFVVHSPGLKTEVLGTTFNINSWPNNVHTEISLYEGSVKLTPEDESVQSVMLSPGQRALLNQESGELDVSASAAENRAAWRNGITVFYNDELFHIASALERKFETRILVADEQAGTLKYTAEFSDESLEKILLLLSEAKAFKYNITEQGVLIQSVN
jgi:ferric-dicitrate binding protein FerR (iron transport regulator)